MAYNKTTWENAPSTNTPINANNLNKMEEGIYQNSLKAENNSTNIGDLTNLETTNKTNIVNAINELIDKEEYSTTQEILTNKTSDGKRVYRAYIEFAHSSANSNYTYTHNLNIDRILIVNGFCTINGQTISSDGYRQLPVFNISNGNMFAIDKIKTNTITTSSVGWANNHAYIWLEYTKVD